MSDGRCEARLAGADEAFRAWCRSNVLGAAKTTEAQVLGKQVLRSATSVGANYREAFRARSKAEFISKCGDCLKEVEETADWLELLAMETLLPLRN